MSSPAPRFAPPRFAHLSALSRAALLAAGVAVIGLSFSAGPAAAGLGQARASVDTDVAHFKARLKSTNTSTYTESDLTGDGGAITREFTNGVGTVFAVAWSGPVRPDLKQLFGDYFPRFQADNASSGRFRRHRPLRSDDLDFVVRTGGHPGAMWGYAYLPQHVPQGFSIEVLQ